MSKTMNMTFFYVLKSFGQAAGHITPSERIGQPGLDRFLGSDPKGHMDHVTWVNFLTSVCPSFRPSIPTFPPSGPWLFQA